MCTCCYNPLGDGIGLVVLIQCGIAAGGHLFNRLIHRQLAIGKLRADLLEDGGELLLGGSQMLLHLGIGVQQLVWKPGFSAMYSCMGA